MTHDLSANGLGDDVHGAPRSDRPPRRLAVGAGAKTRLAGAALLGAVIGAPAGCSKPAGDAPAAPMAGVVRWAHSDPEYKVRPSTAQILAAIDAVKLAGR